MGWAMPGRNDCEVIKPEKIARSIQVHVKFF
jgi:hypothetical protein